MILYQGKIYETTEQNRLLTTLEEDINQTRMQEVLETQIVINALDQISRQIEDGAFDHFINGLHIDGMEKHKTKLIKMLRRDYLECRLKEELGEDFQKKGRTDTPDGIPSIGRAFLPLGTLFHIAAGNMDGLPVFSVMEGLLTGNINILKLPQIDKELSIKILLQLIKIEPKLKDYIYVFDTPSTDLEGMKRMAEISDGIITWGGDEAITAVRKMAPVNARLIEWGHKLGLTYISGYEDKESQLEALAKHIITTKQLLCSSCQVIYLDTESMEEVHAFCREFLTKLTKAAKEEGTPSIGMTAETTLRQYHDELERIISEVEDGTGNEQNQIDKQIMPYYGDNCSLIAKEDYALELSPMFGNCIVKRLPQRMLFSQLRQHKRYLQTAGLICEKNKREDLTKLIIKSGIVRVMRSDSISEGFCGETHDGEYPLRRYMRVVNYQ